MSEKKCNKCKVVKPVNEFYMRKNSKYGRRNECKECRKEYGRQYRQDNKEKIRKTKAEWRKNNKERELAYSKQYHQDNKEKRKEYDKQYYQDNKEEKNKYVKNRRANDPVIALRNNVGTAIAHALNRNDGSKQGESIMKYLPYTIEEMKAHLEGLFTEGMSWENHGEWHIDHIYPQSLLPYDSMSHPNFLKSWDLENLQPLWAEENQSKSNKI